MPHIGLVSLVLYTASMILPSECISQSYQGKTFYLASMPAFYHHLDFRPVLLKIISNEAGTVQVVMPALGTNTTHVLTPKVTEVSLPLSGMTVDAVGIDNKGIQIISTVEVAIYVIKGDTMSAYGEAMSLMPIIYSANVFVVQSHETDINRLRSHFVIIATEDSTDVNITLKTATPGNMTYSNMTFKDGDIINILLNQLETFYAYLPSNDLSGSLIESNKPIAVFSGTNCVNIPKDVGYCDIILSQMTPVSQWDYAYIVPPIYPGRCHIRVFAFYNATHISVNPELDFGRNITLNQGEFWETTLYGSQAQPLVISSDTTINVVLYGASGGNTSDQDKNNPFMLVVPDIHQYSTSATTFPTLLYGDTDSLRDKRPFENYAAIVLLEVSFNQLQYNGMTPDILQNYNVLDEYTVVIIALENVTTHNISIVNESSPIPMAVFVYGMGWRESYGFVAGFKRINADCSGLFTPEHGSLSSKFASHGGHVTVSCDSGYELSGDRILVCSSGSWSGNVGACEEDCQDLIAPLYGSLSSDRVSHGKIVKVSCSKGYTLSGERTILCTSGTWSSSIGTCEADCSGLFTPEHGSLSSKFASHGGHVTVSCDSGYELSGDRILVCSSGSWSGNVGSCEEDCQDLIAPLYGSLSSNRVSHGKIVKVSCSKGYTLSGERTILCTSGTWSSSIGICEADCSGLMAPTHGSLSSKVAFHGHHVTVSCAHGYKLSGDNILVCSSGSWSGIVGACVEDEGPTTASSSPVTSIIVGAVLGFIIIVLLSIIIVMCIQNKRKSVKHTSATRQTLDQVQITEIGNNQDYSSLTDDRADGSTYATLNVSEAPYLTPVSSHIIQYNGNI